MIKRRETRPFYSGYYGNLMYEDDKGNLVPYGTGRGASYWVDPNNTKTKQEYPYSYSEFYVMGNGETKEGSQAVYSDRLAQWDHEKHRRIVNALDKKYGGRFTWAQNAQEYMEQYYPEKPMKVTAVAEGCNASNGYPYWIIWFKQGKETSS